MTRTATISRTTRETSVTVTVDLDGDGTTDVATGVGFFDHLLTSFGHHSLIDLTVRTEGDLHIDDHHTVEDTMLVLGEALAAALDQRAGIARFGDAAVPMDEALARAAVDVGGRPYAVINVPLRTERIGTFTCQNFAHGLEAFCQTAGFTLHLTAGGENDHHIAEAAIKAVARAVRAAVTADPRRPGMASTKGIPQSERTT
ncbi:MAG: imidazoleglycerol-phosphate dehydratase HisB [Acidimicrobiia bacterium]|nr:imidazoleglycerol-phosphate dehydratase HisB [Acidimicrobiia bacterium]